MALEIPDAVHACGLFVGAAVVAPPFTNRLVTANGVAAIARSSAGVYAVTLEQPLNGGEGLALAGLPANTLGSACAQLSADGLTLNVTTFDQAGNAADVPFFYVMLVKVPGGPALALPAAAAPGGGLPFSAAVMTAVTADKVLKAGIINQVDASAGAFSALLPDATVPGAVKVNTLIVTKDVSRAPDANLTIAATGAQLELPTTGALAASFAPAAAEGLYLAYQFDGTNWNVVGYSLH
jgi:hypothetical protein